MRRAHAGPSSPAVDAPDDEPTALGRRHRVWVLLGVAALVVVALIDGPAANVLDRFGLLDRERSFTELYFPEHLALPDEITAGEPLAFDFSVRNREGRSVPYTWQVLVASPRAGGEPATIAQGELRLGDGETGVVHVEQAPPLPPGPSVVDVVLVGRAERIDFHLTVRSAIDAP